MVNSATKQIDVSVEPILTVVMPIYNAGRFLRMAVISVLWQSYTQWELIIIDDGSTDDALQSIGDIKDPRIKVFKDGKNKGLAIRLNEAIALAQGRYIARMDQDDISYPERFFRQIEVLESNNMLDLVAVRAIKITESDMLIGELPYAGTHEEICSAPWRGFYLPHPTWMAKTSWFRKYLYATPAPYFCEDQELLLRSHAKSLFYTIDDVLFAYRVREVVNLKKQLRTRFACLKFQVKYFVTAKQLYLIPLAALNYVLRLGYDFLVLIGLLSMHKGNVDNKAKNNWRHIIERCQ